jgi:hypothetical protein
VVSLGGKLEFAVEGQNGGIVIGLLLRHGLRHNRSHQRSAGAAEKKAILDLLELSGNDPNDHGEGVGVEEIEAVRAACR